MSEREHTLSKDCWCNPTIVNKNGYEYPASTRVRCTKDGEYPEDDITVRLVQIRCTYLLDSTN